MLNWKLFAVTGVVLVGSAVGVFRWMTAPQKLPQASLHTTMRPAVPPPELTTDETDPDAAQPATPMDEYRLALDSAEEYLQSTEGYKATFIRQIRKDGDLLDQEQVSIKIRHEPLGVYMKWQDKDAQEVLYVAGENDGKALARRARGFFRNTIKLDPTSRLAMEDSRYPIYELGMLELVRNAKDVLYGSPDLNAIGCEVESAEVAGRPVRQFTITIDSPEVDATYSKCVLDFVEEDPMFIQIVSNGWDENGQPGGLIEHYYYRDLEMNPGFASDEFQPEFDGYAFRR